MQFCDVFDVSLWLSFPLSDSPDPLGLTFFFAFFCLLSSGQLYGLEKFWAYLKYSKTKTLEIDPKLQEYLSKFKRLEDFRVDVSRISKNQKMPHSTEFFT